MIKVERETVLHDDAYLAPLLDSADRFGRVSGAHLPHEVLKDIDDVPVALCGSLVKGEVPATCKGLDGGALNFTLVNEVELGADNDDRDTLWCGWLSELGRSKGVG